MAHLVPYPLGRLASRILRELEGTGPVLDLPRNKVVRGGGGFDWSTVVHGHRVSTPLGPAAGPHTQLAQNLVLGFLGGCRIFELKTVQILDELVIPRPCIDARTVGFNVEWSQELKLEQSLEEYVKASMLIELLIASGKLGLEPGFESYVFDLSVGYDLKGIRHERVQAFLDGMKDATPIVDRLRAELPRPYRDLPFRTKLSDSLTLSTFHGCPPQEIEGIARHLMERVGLHCVVKLNPTLNGPDEARRLFHDVLGYRYRIPDAAFANDPTFEQAVELIGRLEETARQTGRELGVKFSNTLVVENEGDFLPRTEKTAYLSGQPLHVLAMNLVARFRDVFGDRLPISFSAGIDRQNFPDAVALGLKPVTVCTDLLRPGGYGRLAGYFDELAHRMSAVDAKTLDDFVLRARGYAGTDVSAARLHNTTQYVQTLAGTRRYTAAENARAPRKVGSTLVLFDCLTCDKCVPVCPNHANFTYPVPATTVPVVKLSRASDGTWIRTSAPPLVIEQKHQLANFADFCNECGNCDVFCPEDGGPYLLKPRFFGSEATWSKGGDGVWVQPDGTTHGRFKGQEYTLRGAHFSGRGFDLDLTDLEAPRGHAEPRVEIDVTWFHVLRLLRDGVLGAAVNYVNA
jgi:putative selenate reductase